MVSENANMVDGDLSRALHPYSYKEVVTQAGMILVMKLLWGHLHSCKQLLTILHR